MRTKIDRNQVISEMITTETSYNQALTLMQEALSKPEIIGSSLFLKELSPQISILKLISDQLLLNGKKGIELDISAEQHTPLRIQRTQLLNSFFHAYKDYAQLFNRYLSEMQNNPKQFENIDNYLRTHTPNKLNFESHLIMPVQRGPRYAILVAAAKANKKHLHPENLAEFDELEQNLRELLKAINSKLHSPSVSDSYWVGKYTYEFVFGKTTQTSAMANSSNSHTSSKPYQFGDLTRGLFGKVRSTFFSPGPDAVEISAPSSSRGVDLADEFELFDFSSSDDETPAP